MEVYYLLLQVISDDMVTLVVSGILSGTLGTVIVALLRVRRDNEKTVVDSAQGAVIVQHGVITSLREEIERRDAAIEAKDKEIDDFILQIEQLEMQNELLKQEVKTLKQENT